LWRHRPIQFNCFDGLISDLKEFMGATPFIWLYLFLLGIITAIIGGMMDWAIIYCHRRTHGLFLSHRHTLSASCVCVCVCDECRGLTVCLTIAVRYYLARAPHNYWEDWFMWGSTTLFFTALAIAACQLSPVAQVPSTL
jgi:hypothetical protein